MSENLQLPQKLYFTQTRYRPYLQKTVNQGVILLPGGCYWGKKRETQCIMCGFQNAVNYFMSQVKHIDEKFFTTNIRQAFSCFREQKIESAIIYTGGSFFELPITIRELVINEGSFLKELSIETRPEYINEKIPDVDLIKNVTNINIYIGLETCTEEIRFNCINKKFTNETFESAICNLRKNGIRASTYVLLKPLGLNEKESIIETIKTIKYSFNLGVSEVALQSTFVQPGTLLEDYYNKQNFTPAWIWSIINVIEDTIEYGPVLLGGFDDEPKPIRIPENCDQCTGHFLILLDEYRKTLHTPVLKNHFCKCKVRWEKEISNFSYKTFLDHLINRSK